jgi:hypothetical protein
VLEHCREREINWGFFIFGAITSDRIPKATKNVNVQLSIYIFTSSSNSCELQQLIPESFISYYVQLSFERALIPYQHYSINPPYASVIRRRPSLNLKWPQTLRLKK